MFKTKFKSSWELLNTEVFTKMTMFAHIERAKNIPEDPVVRMEYATITCLILEDLCKKYLLEHHKVHPINLKTDIMVGMIAHKPWINPKYWNRDVVLLKVKLGCMTFYMDPLAIMHKDYVPGIPDYCSLRKPPKYFSTFENFIVNNKLLMFIDKHICVVKYMEDRTVHIGCIMYFREYLWPKICLTFMKYD